MKRTLLFIFLSLFLLDGCSSHRVNEILKDVESYIMERPDSALAVLDTMDRTLLKNEHLRAHHALLHAMALDKNYIDVTDDSLALTAVKYYQKHGPKRNLARSLYYLALSYFNDRKYDKAIIKLIEAENVAQNSDSLYLGFVKVLQADIHSVNHDGVSEGEALVKALDVYTDINAEKYINIVRHRIARALINNQRYNEAKVILEDLLGTDNLKQSTLTYAIGDYAFLLGTCPDADYNSSDEYYKRRMALDSNNMTTQDYWVWAYALSEIGNREKSHKLVNDLRQIDSSCTACYFMYKIAKNEERYGDALKYLEKFTAKNNDEVVQVLKQSISIAQRDYYQSQYEISENIIRIRSLILWIVIISTLFILSLICIYIIRYRRKKEEEKVYYIRYAGEVSRQLDEFKNGTYSSLQKKYISMYKTKYETLQILFEKYLQTEDRVDAERLIYKRVVSLIDELRKDIENSTRFDRNLDEELNGMMTKLRTELPTLNKRYYTLFGYLALGFNSTIISHFMGCSENAVRIIKNRLKGIVKNSDAEHKLDFLEVIG